MNRAILVKSCQKNHDRQDASAQSWGLDIRAHHVDLHFVEGGHDRDGHSATVGKMLLRLETDDRLQGNSHKLAKAIYFLTRSYTELDCLFICDDDTFVHPKRWLSHEPVGDLECRVYRPRDDADRQRNNGRPWIHGGAGWWMSRRMCELYVEHCHERTSADDIIAAHIAQEHGIELVDRPDLYGCNSYGGEAGWVSKDNSLITCHPVRPEEMRTLWEGTNGI